MKLKELNIAYRIGLGIAFIHFLIVILMLLLMPFAGQSAIGLLFLLERIDFFLEPLMFSIPGSGNAVIGLLQLFIINGILGSLIWSAMPLIIGMFMDFDKKDSEKDQHEPKG